MNRIAKKFNDLKRLRKKALIVYIAAGDPNLKKTEELVYALDREGVDLIELGIPFSDPLADGPVIQQATQRALKNGVNISKILKTVYSIRKKTQIPLLLMGYLNPIMRYGYAAFARDAQKAGVDGVIIPDLPPDEGHEIGMIFKKEKLGLVYFLAPTSGIDRVKKVIRQSKGFIYYVSVTGVTGARNSAPAEIKNHIQQIKKLSKTPVCVGFGISKPEHAKKICEFADGVIVGSAIVKEIEKNKSLNAAEFTKKFVRPYLKIMGKAG